MKGKCDNCKKEGEVILIDDQFLCKDCAKKFLKNGDAATDMQPAKKKSSHTFRKIAGIVFALFVCGAGIAIYGSANSLSPTDELAYSTMEKCSKNFKNPDSMKLQEAYINDDNGKKDTLYAKVTAQNGFGGYQSKYYRMHTDGTIENIDDDIKSLSEKPRVGNETNVEETFFATAKYGGKKVNVDRVNKKFKEHHQ